jgi:hypothetical protein
MREFQGVSPSVQYDIITMESTDMCLDFSDWLERLELYYNVTLEQSQSSNLFIHKNVNSRTSNQKEHVAMRRVPAGCFLQPLTCFL